jgi:hypothetical protein
MGEGQPKPATGWKAAVSVLDNINPEDKVDKEKSSSTVDR